MISKALSKACNNGIIVDKIKDAKFINKLQTTFDYFQVYEKLYGFYLQLTDDGHVCFLNLVHECYLVRNLKYGYSVILVHLET